MKSWNPNWNLKCSDKVSQSDKQSSNWFWQCELSIGSQNILWTLQILQSKYKINWYFSYKFRLHLCHFAAEVQITKSTALLPYICENKKIKKYIRMMFILQNKLYDQRLRSSRWVAMTTFQCGVAKKGCCFHNNF